MKFTLMLLSLFLVLTLTGCASQSPSTPLVPSKPKPYTQTEKQEMTPCVYIADTARGLATQRLQGIPIQDIKLESTNPAEQKFLDATLHKVYHDRFTSAWDYSIAFFGECAKNLAGINPERADLAAYCFQNQLIAEVASDYKSKGKPRQLAYEHFAQLRSKAPNAIIDQVYASGRSLTQIKLDVWDGCMQKLVN